MRSRTLSWGSAELPDAEPQWRGAQMRSRTGYRAPYPTAGAVAAMEGSADALPDMDMNPEGASHPLAAMEGSADALPDHAATLRAATAAAAAMEGSADALPDTASPTQATYSVSPPQWRGAQMRSRTSTSASASTST